MTIKTWPHFPHRKVPYMQGKVAIQYNPPVKDMAERLKAKGMLPKAITAGALHKLVHLIHKILKTRQPFDTNSTEKASEVVETDVSAALPLSVNESALDFQEGICPRYVSTSFY